MMTRIRVTENDRVAAILNPNATRVTEELDANVTHGTAIETLDPFQKESRFMIVGDARGEAKASLVDGCSKNQSDLMDLAAELCAAIVMDTPINEFLFPNWRKHTEK